MAIAGIPSEKFSTIPADFGPMPGSCRSHAFASASGISRRNDRSSEPPFSSRTFSSTSLIRGALTFASPPGAMASSMSAMLPRATASSVPKRSMSLANARPELMSDVCWERIVKTISSVGGSLRSWGKGPYSRAISSTAWATRAGDIVGLRRFTCFSAIAEILAPA